MGVLLKLTFPFLAISLYNGDFIQAEKPTVFCYLTASAYKRTFPGNFTVRYADTQRCTHLVYGFMSINNKTNKIESDDYEVDFGDTGGQLKELKALKTRNPKIKILASVGWHCTTSAIFSEMAQSSSRKAAFINSLMTFIREWDLDGIDICWHFPVLKGGTPEDKENFIILLTDIKNVFQRLGWLLTVHIVAKKYLINKSYDVKSMSNIVDYINLDTVGFYRTRDNRTEVVAPLKAENENNFDFLVNYAIETGANPSKILLGIPAYGRMVIVRENIKPGKYFGLYTSQRFKPLYTERSELISFYEVCLNIKNTTGWKQEWDQDSSTPIAYKGQQFVSYDDERSLLEKVKLVDKYKLGGISFWTLDMDDFVGMCHNKTYPLLSAVSEYFEKEEKSKPKKSKGVNEIYG